MTKVDTSNFALKTNVAEIKNKVDGIDINKKNIMDEPQGKNFVKSSYLYLNREYEYFEIDKINPHKPLSWKSAGISNEKLEPPEDKNISKVLLVIIESFKFVAQKKLSYTHDSIVNICIVYLMPDLTDAKESDLMRYGLFGDIAYTMGK